jgi:hypothetical protein
VIFVVVDEEIDNFCPILKSFTRTDKEIFLVEDMQDLVLELFYKDWSLLE